MLFWGLRNLRLNNSVFGQERIKISIEIGDKKFESNPIENCLTNDNFQKTHQIEEIVFQSLLLYVF
jgi:hypothetical protein